MFGQVQLEIKKIEQILDPEQYRDILSCYGKVLVDGKEWSALDFKAEVAKHVKSRKTFKISKAKRLVINSVRLEVAKGS